MTDIFYCLEGRIEVESRNPPRRVVLNPGGKCSVVPRTIHHVSNASDGTSRYLLIQGVGGYDFVREE